MVAWATFSRSSVVVTKGKLAVLRSSPGVTRGFCADCGAHLTYSRDDRAAEVDVTLASLDDGSELRPTVHIWVAEKLPWVIISDGLPQYERRVPGALATNHVMPS